MNNNYQAVLEKARQAFAEKDPQQMALNGAAAFFFYPSLSTRELILPFLGRFYNVSWPTGEVNLFGVEKGASVTVSLIILHYLTRATGEPPGGKWLSFKELWGGRSYNAAFEQRAIKPLGKFFHQNLEGFAATMSSLGGRLYPSFQNGYLHFALPRLPLLCLLQPGDEEIPTGSSILFDSAANSYLETEDLAVLGEVLTHRALTHLSS